MQTRFPQSITTKDGYTSDAYIEHGVLRWASNNRVPPKDVVEYACDSGQITADIVLNSEPARDADLTKFLQDRAEFMLTQEGQECQREMDMMARWA